MNIKIKYNINNNLQEQLAIQGKPAHRERICNIETKNPLIISLAVIDKNGEGTINQIVRKIDRGASYSSTIDRIIQNEIEFLNFYNSKTSCEIKQEKEREEYQQKKIELERKEIEKNSARDLLQEEIDGYKKKIAQITLEKTALAEKIKKIKNNILIKKYSTGKIVEWDNNEYNDSDLSYSDLRKLEFSQDDATELIKETVEGWTKNFDDGGEILVIKIDEHYYKLKF